MDNLSNQCLTFEGRHIKRFADDIHRCLDQQGIVVIKELVKEDYTRKLMKECCKTISRLKNSESSKFLYAEENPDVKYRDLEKSKETVFYVRGDEDKGFIDIFNAQYLFRSQFIKVHKQLKESGLLEILANKYNKIKITSKNIYYTKNLTSTRGFHVDRFLPKLKLFIYLNDVDKLDGPYTYIKESHRSYIRNVNRFINKISKNKITDMRIYNPTKKIICEAAAGDAVLSFQDGIHRGMPQLSDNERLVLTYSFRGLES